MSNTAWALEALHVSGVQAEDESFKRALVFLQRCQMDSRVNEMNYAKGSRQGGFIYATSVNRDQVAVGQSFADKMEETLDDGTKASRLRAYGSMTYAGFKSYVYANLSKDDMRVKLAREWISRNYTLAENPGLGKNGLYYYYVTFARAMEAWGEPTLEVVNADGSKRTTVWREDLVNRLAELQDADGSFKSLDERWMENDKVLITAYALMALQSAGRE
jgi:squalene-hopene/tetraprenyl-beta-curcumene cyclase